jgi:DNA polymerase family A
LSGNGAVCPTSFDRFREIWGVDFEFQPDDCGRPVPVLMVAKEHGGRTIVMRGPELRGCGQAPFDVGDDVLVTSYSIPAELGCFLSLNWHEPRHVLCTFTEVSAQINGLDIVGLEKRRPKLFEAMDLFGLPHPPLSYKMQMRNRILAKPESEYTPQDWQDFEHYCAGDVDEEAALLTALAPEIDLQAALFRGKFLKVVACMERRGLPVDSEYLALLQDRWQDLRLHYIRALDHDHLYDEGGSFSEERFFALIEQRGWAPTWPRTPSGRFALDQKTFGKRAKRHPELKPLQQLRDQIAELRLGSFINTIGADSASRISLLPFWTNTGRCQPSGKNKAFLLGLPSWLHGLIKPREGYGIACIDWVAQELAIAAGLSGDEALIRDYRTGDLHLQFAKKAGLVPEWATKQTHGQARDLVKPVSLGVGFGMTKYGISAQTGKSLLWSRETLARYHHAYPVSTSWRHNVATQALFDEKVSSPLRWSMHVHRDTRRRSLLNFVQQATGADVMRAAAIAGHDAGIGLLVPMHDAFWIAAPINELEEAIKTMRELMTRVGEAICGIPIATEESARVTWPQCLGDVRSINAKGQQLWTEIRNLVTSGALRRVG